MRPDSNAATRLRQRSALGKLTPCRPLSKPATLSSLLRRRLKTDRSHTGGNTAESTESRLKHRSQASPSPPHHVEVATNGIRDAQTSCQPAMPIVNLVGPVSTMIRPAVIGGGGVRYSPCPLSEAEMAVRHVGECGEAQNRIESSVACCGRRGCLIGSTIDNLWDYASACRVFGNRSPSAMRQAGSSRPRRPFVAEFTGPEGCSPGTSEVSR